MHLSPRTVETYRARVMEKVQLKDVVALVKLVIGNGMSTVDWQRSAQFRTLLARVKAGYIKSAYLSVQGC